MSEAVHIRGDDDGNRGTHASAMVRYALSALDYLPRRRISLRLTHAPDAVLIYESGPIGAKPSVLPLSIGDGNLGRDSGHSRLDS